MKKSRTLVAGRLAAAIAIAAAIVFSQGGAGFSDDAGRIGPGRGVVPVSPVLAWSYEAAEYITISPAADPDGGVYFGAADDTV